MAYNRENYYKKIIEVQKVFLEQKALDEDIYTKTIYWDFIYPKFFICYRTFHTYLEINAKAELKKLQEAKQDIV